MVIKNCLGNAVLYLLSPWRHLPGTFPTWHGLRSRKMKHHVKEVVSCIFSLGNSDPVTNWLDLSIRSAQVASTIQEHGIKLWKWTGKSRIDQYLKGGKLSSYSKDENVRVMSHHIFRASFRTFIWVTDSRSFLLVNVHRQTYKEGHSQKLFLIVLFRLDHNCPFKKFTMRIFTESIDVDCVVQRGKLTVFRYWVL